MAFLHWEQRSSYLCRHDRPHHLLNRSQSSPFALCYMRRVDCPSCSIASRNRQRFTRAWMNVYSLDVTIEGHLQVEKFAHSSFSFMLTSLPAKKPENLHFTEILRYVVQGKFWKYTELYRGCCLCCIWFWSGWNTVSTTVHCSGTETWVCSSIPSHPSTVYWTILLQYTEPSFYSILKLLSIVYWTIFL